MIELLVPCRGRGRPVKNTQGRLVDPMRNYVIKPKTFTLQQLTVDKLAQVVDGLE